MAEIGTSTYHTSFAYRVAVQESTKASLFYLLYGREPQIPISDALAQPRTIYQVDFPDYLTGMVANLPDAWGSAHHNIEKAQWKQKEKYDKKSSASTLKVGETFFPSQVKGKAWKLAWPYFGSYKVLSFTLMPRYSWHMIRKVSQSLSLSIVFAVVTMKCQMKFVWETVLKLRGALSIPNLMLVCRLLPCL